MQSKSAPKWLSDVDVADRYSVSRITIWRWAKAGRIPSPRKLSPGCARWSTAELDAHDARLITEAA